MGIYAMSKKSQKDVNRQVASESVKNKLNNSKVAENSALEVTVGLANVKRWNLLKASFSCETNQSFTTKLLDLAQEYLNRNPCKTQEDKRNQKKGDNEPILVSNKRRKNDTKRDKKELLVPIEENIAKNDEEGQFHNQTSTHPNENSQPSTSEQQISLIKDQNHDSSAKNVMNKSAINSEQKEEKGKKKKASATLEKPLKKDKSSESKKKIDHDIRKAPELELQTESKIDAPKTSHESESANKVAVKIKLCQSCGTHHVQDQCPLSYPNFVIPDSVDLSNWQSTYQNLYVDQTEFIKSERDTDPKPEINKYVFAKVSLPNFLQLVDSNTDHGLGVFAKIDIQEFTQFGPLVGKVVKEVDISEDSNMKDIWEICGENSNTYFNTENLETSNWMRFVRPAATRDEKNITLITKENSLYFVSVKLIKNGEELLYWQDSTVATNKKKMEKTSCGGCNMTFAHPLYYRTHCSVFHDIRYSLTIRKYHCKVCGAAVLGKENIMKHAAELHNGQGAYQCQFCKKFFLRLNYLEMHRTYGCSANPHRSRPLCDFCGRKFCQPQKLKVHIKRMHSDFAEVLKEFQCKNCLKILGSRAALQRHLKEVHQKQMDGACSCNRCGKHFQNKSNLKIHMLTHSGIKPFKCVVKSCNAAFTTKQCLQFHYKKVHSFTEDMMPKIERSIDYTFEAYSGLEDQDEKIKNDSLHTQHNDSNAATLDEDSDCDETSTDSKNLDDPPMPESPIQVQEEQSPEPNPRASPVMETYNMNAVNTTMKILSKGSKKWIGDQPLQPLKSDLYQIDHRLSKDELPAVQIQVPESQVYDRTKLNSTNLNDFTRHEASNASLLVEAALDSVCSEPNIDIDVSTTPNCTDALNNLYTLAPSDSLPDVTYSESVCINEPRDINLISPSVNDHISVTDELNDELRHNQNIGMDYSGFHQEDFSPGNSPEIHPRASFVRNYINTLSPQNQNYGQSKNLSPVPVPSPPRYDFGHTVATADHLSSDDSNGMAAQNLSLHSKHDIQLDLSIYKSPYKIDGPSFPNRKDFRIKFDDIDKNKVYNLGIDGGSKSYIDEDNNPLENEQVEAINQNDLANNIQVVDMKDKENDDNERNKYPDDLSTDIRGKFDIDLDLRLKSYDVDSESLRPRGLYETNDLEFRNKTYDVIDNMENRSKPYDGSMETDFRPDRNFEPLVLNSSELQGLDMSARSFHNYSNINRYHHLYPDVDRVDLRLNYSPPAPSYTHADILRVVSLDLTPPGRHSVDLSLRTHSLHQIANSRLLSEHAIQSTQHRLLDQGRLLSSDLSGRILSDHTTNRILSNNDQLTSNHLLSADQRLLNDDSRIMSEQPRLLEQSRLIGDGRILAPTTPSGAVSPIPAFSGYSVSQSPYHPTPLAPRPHVSSPTPTPYHHYSTYY